MKLLSLSDTHEYIVLRTIHFYIHKTFTDDIQTMTELFKFKVENSRDFLDGIWASDLHETRLLERCKHILLWSFEFLSSTDRDFWLSFTVSGRTSYHNISYRITQSYNYKI
jgi:hypothetical protein